VRGSTRHPFCIFFFFFHILFVCYFLCILGFLVFRVSGFGACWVGVFLRLIWVFDAIFFFFLVFWVFDGGIFYFLGFLGASSSFSFFFFSSFVFWVFDRGISCILGFLLALGVVGS
jgi:hypothetical protein